MSKIIFISLLVCFVLVIVSAKGNQWLLTLLLTTLKYLVFILFILISFFFPIGFRTSKKSRN